MPPKKRPAWYQPTLDFNADPVEAPPPQESPPAQDNQPPPEPPPAPIRPSFVARVASERKKSQEERNGDRPASHAARVRMYRDQPLNPLYDLITPAAPPVDQGGTVIIPPGITSGNGDPTPLPAGNGAALPVGDDS